MVITRAGKMICPKCGFEMNHHGDKIVFDESQVAETDKNMGGYLEEFHTCPNCGASASRPAA
jgi:predicted RNA-binding Zn-ribbon protein involved in translation (DUF1610 family)